jgi:hypothetical protein
MSASPVARVALGLAIALLFTAACSTSTAVPLVIRSHGPVKATSTQLREGVVQAIKTWADAKTRIEELHARRVGEMLSIEADVAFLEEVARIDAGGSGGRPDPGRLEKLLGLKADAPTFEQELAKALAPTAAHRSPAQYFEYLDGVKAGFTPAEMDRLTGLVNRLDELRGPPGPDEKRLVGVRDVAEWLAARGYVDWSELITRFARRDPQGRLVADGATLIDEIRKAAADLRVEPPDLPELRQVGFRTIARLRHRREQFAVVDRLLSNLLTIANDLDTYLQNDSEAIHWQDAGRAIGKAESLSSDLREELGGGGPR